MRTIQDDIDRQQDNTPFHRFLLANRPYCEFCSGPFPSTRIIMWDNHEKAVCDAHARAFLPSRNQNQNQPETKIQ